MFLFFCKIQHSNTFVRPVNQALFLNIQLNEHHQNCFKRNKQTYFLIQTTKYYYRTVFGTPKGSTDLFLDIRDIIMQIKSKFNISLYTLLIIYFISQYIFTRTVCTKCNKNDPPFCSQLQCPVWSRIKVLCKFKCIEDTDIRTGIHKLICWYFLCISPYRSPV